MQRCSNTIGAIAAAIAKAQLELSNPEKALTATIASPFPRESTKSFRYASLASGLDLVRKSLGRHEIATVQTTSIDEGAGLIRLTTTLAHSSGEWVASDWPVCPITDTAAPHRMGAALTYARRYALFTLVGIAGEDDLDAPDLVSSASPTGPGSGQAAAGPPPLTSSGAEADAVVRPAGRGGLRKPSLPQPKAALSLAQSSLVRDQLLGQLSRLSGPDLDERLALWARESLPVKNTLTVEDARRVDETFAARLEAGGKLEAGAEESATRSIPIDKSALTISEPRRYRDKAHLKLVASQACLICGREPSDPHHLKFAQPRALGRKVSDEFVVPLCRSHHRELHRGGNEKAWWGKIGIDPLPVATALWAQTRLVQPDPAFVAEDLTPQAGSAMVQIHETKPIEAGAAR